MASPIAVDGGNMPPDEKWDPSNQMAVAENGTEARNGNGVHPQDEEHHPIQQQPSPTNTNEYTAHNGDAVNGNGGDVVSAGKPDTVYRGEKQVKPNKVYIGGLPEHTRKEDLQSCFGKIGNIVNIELKVGYGFVEFDSREAAEESVAKYHEGFFMGNKIRVEISRGGRTAKYGGDPGACFKCGQTGHWARECPSTVSTRHPSDAPLIDRIQPPRDYPPPPPPRDYPPYRDDYARYPPPRDSRYGYDYPPVPREYRRPPSPVRDYRDYPPVRPPRDLEDFRGRGPPPARYEPRPGYYPPEDIPPPAYPPRGYAPPPPRDYYDRYDRRPPPPVDRYAPYPPRPRTPPPASIPPRPRDDYDRERPSPRDYPPADYRGRPPSPPPASRYADYPPRSGSSDAPRYRRRSQSPPSRSASGAYETYPPNASGAGYTRSSSNGYAGNGYSGETAAPGSRGSTAPRDYPAPRSRDGDNGSYRRP